MIKSYEGFLHSNLLWTDTQFGLKQFVFPIVEVDNNSLSPIPGNLRLGHQVEHIYLELLNASDEYDVLAHSVQLIENKQTLGELDYIIKSNVTQEIIHIELAYKFYLLDPTMDGPVEGLVGPNRSDAFTYKMSKTKNKQMPLLYSVAAKKALEIDVNQIAQQVAFYAQIFVPYKDGPYEIGALNTDCIVGYWLNLNLFTSGDFIQWKFYIPQKREWLHIPHEDVAWLDYQSVLEVLSDRHSIKRSPMLWMMKNTNEILKIFITFWK